MNLFKRYMIDKIWRCLPIAVIGMMLVACNDDPVAPPVVPVDEGETFMLDVSLDVADISTAQSRAFSDTPDYGNLKLYMVEFEGGGSPLENNFIRQINTIEGETVNADGDVHFKVTLVKADQPRILHLIALPKTAEFKIDYLTGLEGAIMPALKVSDDTPAYWQRVEFPKGYGHYVYNGNDYTWETYGDVKTKLTHVPMLCNFAKVSLTSSATGFTLEGFALMNRPKEGSMVPYISSSNTFPTFLNSSGQLDYSTIDAAYKGYTPSTKVTDNDPAAATFDKKDKFLYERPHSSLNNPVVIMQGSRNGKSMFYKIDIGYKDETTNLFHFYDILRNFEYAINVTSVGADGYATAQDALNGVVFNNFSFDVQTKQLLSISDGKALLQTNNTTFVVTSPDSTNITLYYKYEDLTTSTKPKDNNTIEFLDEKTGLKNDAIKGDAITLLTISDDDESAGAYEGWRKVTITTPTPKSDRVSQEIVMFDPSTGLGRIITIIVRIPWKFIEPGVWGGTYYYLSQYVDTWSGFVSNSTTTGQPLTVRFRIGDNIPEAMFPLKFVFEADKQNIQNNYVDNLVVSPGESLFPKVTTNVIKYVKTISWANYNTYKSEKQSGLIDKGADGTEHHYVTAHFLTIDPITTATTTIRVQNPYMSTEPDAEKPTHYFDVTFNGKGGSAPTYTYTSTATN